MALRHAALAKAIARNIRERAARRGMPIDTLADLAGISRSYLYAVLGARNAITVDKLASIAEALESTITALVVDSPPPPATTAHVRRVRGRRG